MAQYKIGFVAGNFDLIHPGYIKLFQHAKKKCQFLIVGLHHDPSLERKEKMKPIHNIQERKLILSSIKYIDKIIVYKTEKDLLTILKSNKIDIRFLDDSYKKMNFTGKELDLKISWVPRKHHYSMTYLKKQIIKASVI